jgi:hypothetical protein
MPAGRLALAHIEPCLEGLGILLAILAVEAAALLDMDLEAGVLGWRVVARAGRLSEVSSTVQSTS